MATIIDGKELAKKIRANLKIKDIAYPTVDNLIDYRNR